MGAKLQPAPLVAGLGVILIGVLVLLDAQNVITLGFGALAPLACAVAGATLLASGLTRSG
ncbi:MAG TPA: hypothetical protein VH817_22410 [Thermoleophilaceae bacterium]|jgi:hypothetical protein